MSKPSCMAPDNETKTPRFKAPPQSCDAHCHVFGPHAYIYFDACVYHHEGIPRLDARLAEVGLI